MVHLRQRHLGLISVSLTLWVLAYLVMGVFIGLFAGLLGIGGGLIIVPILAILFPLQAFPFTTKMQVILTTAMSTIIFTSLSSLRASSLPWETSGTDGTPPNIPRSAMFIYLR